MGAGRRRHQRHPAHRTLLYPNGLLVLRFDTNAGDVRTAVVPSKDIRAIEMTHSPEWYFEYQHGGPESAFAWGDDPGPATASIRFRHPVLDLGEELAFPLSGRERRYPGDWDLIRTLRERLLGVAGGNQ